MEPMPELDRDGLWREIDLRTKELGYFLCVRPLRAGDAQKYLMVSTEGAKSSVSQRQLPIPFVDRLDRELSRVEQQIADGGDLSG